MQAGDNIVRVEMQVQPERLARGPVEEQGARIDPLVYLAEGRRRQARAMGEAVGASWRALRRGLTDMASLLRRHMLQPLARRSERRRAIGRLAELDDRLLADIGLRRGDIALAVDGLLADPRVTRRAVPPTGVAQLRAGEHCPAPEATANSYRPDVPAPRDRVGDLAA